MYPSHFNYYITIFQIQFHRALTIFFSFSFFMFLFIIIIIFFSVISTSSLSLTHCYQPFCPIVVFFPFHYFFVFFHLFFPFRCCSPLVLVIQLLSSHSRTDIACCTMIHHFCFNTSTTTLFSSLPFLPLHFYFCLPTTHWCNAILVLSWINQLEYPPVLFYFILHTFYIFYHPIWILPFIWCWHWCDSQSLVFLFLWWSWRSDSFYDELGALCPDSAYPSSVSDGDA